MFINSRLVLPFSKNLFILFILIQTLAFAQKKATTSSLNFGKGITFTSPDSLFTMALNGRIQSLYEAKRDITNDTYGSDFILRRCRLNIQGTAFNPKFNYRIQIGFAHGDITSGNSTVQNNLILRDAILFYDAKKWLRMGFGQTKLPGNRQRQESSANLQLVERSIANNNFTLDRDKGIWFYTKFNINKALLKTTLAVSSGEGRILSNKNGKLAYSGRMELLPLGAFKNNGDYIESDQERESKPKIAIAAAYSYNKAAPRTMGQLGEYLYNNETSNLTYYGADFLLKYRGFSLESELYHRESDKGVIINNSNPAQSNAAMAGTTFMVQTGYFVSKTNEIAARYAHITPDSKVAAVVKNQKEYVLGFSHYFYKHSLKLQTDVTRYENGNAESLVYRLSGVVTF